MNTKQVECTVHTARWATGCCATCCVFDSCTVQVHCNTKSSLCYPQIVNLYVSKRTPEFDLLNITTT